MTTTARLKLPFIVPGQAQKELIHNEALARLDITVNASAQSSGLNIPPTTPVNGQSWIVGDLPAAAWAGYPNCLAAWTEGGWRFLQPYAGLIVWLVDRNVFAYWDGVEWVAGHLSAAAVTIGGKQVVGERQSAISDPAGGATVDVEARSAIEHILSAMRAHGLIEV